MPILHIQVNAEVTAPDGAIEQILPSIALVHRGPCVQVTIGLAQSVAEQLLQQGQAVPEPVSGIGLIDTGASSTCIDEAVAQAMGLPIVDVALMASASHDAVECNLYPVQIEFVGAGMSLNATRAMGANLQSQGLLALIGRDALFEATLFYNGLTGEITLAR